MEKLLKNNLLFLAWLQAAVATVGSLYISEVMKYPPCSLCWYQRAMMYPLAVLLLVGIIKKDKRVYDYALPVALIGLALAIMHNLLYYNLLPGSLVACLGGISCTIDYLGLFGFVTVPLLSLIGFTVITGALIWHKRLNSRGED